MIPPQVLIVPVFEQLNLVGLLNTYWAVILPQVPSDLVGAVQGAASPSGLTDLVAAYLDFESDKKQELIETIDPVARIDKVTAILAHRIEVLRLTAEIGRQTKATFDERQKEAVLREQMAAIQKQLGEGDAGRAQEVAAGAGDAVGQVGPGPTARAVVEGEGVGSGAGEVEQHGARPRGAGVSPRPAPR